LHQQITPSSALEKSQEIQESSSEVEISKNFRAVTISSPLAKKGSRDAPKQSATCRNYGQGVNPAQTEVIDAGTRKCGDIRRNLSQNSIGKPRVMPVEIPRKRSNIGTSLST
jgi:hypothetical protein